VIVLGNPEWRPSLLGLVANSLAEEYGAAVFLWGRDGEGAIKGSCRSRGLDIVALMNNTPSGTFLEYGGHALSGGFTVLHDKVHGLDALLRQAAEVLRAKEGNGESGMTQGAGDAEPEVLVDESISIDDVSWNLYDSLAKLAPFGTGNPKPLFIFRDVIPADVRLFGKEANHTELVFHNSRGAKVNAIGFFMKPESFTPAPVAGKPLDLIATLEKSTFRGRPELRLRIQDIVSRV